MKDKDVQSTSLSGISVEGRETSAKKKRDKKRDSLLKTAPSLNEAAQIPFSVP